MKDYTQVERDNAALTIREYAFGQMNMLRMLGDEDAANNLQEAINMAIVALRGPEWVRTADRLPEAADGITGATGEPEVLTICEFAHGWFPEVIRVSEVVRMPKYYRYWMPLPEPPGEEVEG